MLTYHENSEVPLSLYGLISRFYPQKMLSQVITISKCLYFFHQSYACPPTLEFSREGTAYSASKLNGKNNIKVYYIPLNKFHVLKGPFHADLLDPAWS